MGEAASVGHNSGNFEERIRFPVCAEGEQHSEPLVLVLSISLSRTLSILIVLGRPVEGVIFKHAGVKSF